MSHLETLKHERDQLQILLQNQKFAPADVERINREKRELQQMISTLSKSLEDAEQYKCKEEITLSKVKEMVMYLYAKRVWFMHMKPQAGRLLVLIQAWNIYATARGHN